MNQDTGNPQLNAARGKRNKVIMIAWLAGVLILAGLFAHLTVTALNVRATTSSEFSQYVTNHHIGKAEVSNDFSRMQQDFCLLHLDHDMTANQMDSSFTEWMKQYYELDGGHSLTVEYDIPNTGKKKILGDAYYDDVSKTLRLTLNADGDSKVVEKKVDWPTNNSD